MISLNVIGSFEGCEESKSHEGKFYAYVKPLAKTPRGILKPVKVKPKFGPVRDGIEIMGMFALICEESQIPTIGIGEKVSASAVVWPTNTPRWSDRQNSIVPGSETSFQYVLDGEIKPSNAKAKEPTFKADGYYTGALRLKDNRVRVKCSIEDVPPSWLLRQQRTRKGKAYMTVQEELGIVQFTVEAGNVPAIPSAAPIEVTGEVWPISEPYFDEKQDSVSNRVIPTPVFFANSLNIQKEAAKA